MNVIIDILIKMLMSEFILIKSPIQIDIGNIIARKKSHEWRKITRIANASSVTLNFEITVKNMLESRPEDALVKLFRLWRLWRLWRLYRL